MRRIRLIAVAAGVAAFAALLAPGVASASSSFTWDLASDFTATGGGANPDHDQYGGTPWSYTEGPVRTGLAFFHTPLAPLSGFSTAVRGGLAGWSDPADSPAFIGINPTDAAISQAPVSYPAHEIAIQPPADRLVAVAWTSPFPEPVTVSVGGSVGQDDPDAACLVAEPQWSLDDNGSQLLAGFGNGLISDAAVTVAPGDVLAVTVTPAALAGCSNVGLSLRITANAVAPAVTLASPARGAVIGHGQPTFAGTAGTDFGDSHQITVRIYTGSSASGSPFETLTTRESGGAYQVGPTTPLADGTYTAQAEQDDILSPPVVGLSPPVTFSVENRGPKVTLDPLGGKPSHTGTPRLAGTAGSGSAVVIAVFAGSGENGSPVRTATATANSKGAFSARITPTLSDGIYTAVAAQRSDTGGAPGISRPMTFEIKANGPVVSLTTPAAGASVASSLPIFAGVAGSAPGDSSMVTVTVYSGGSVRGKRIGEVTTTASGGKWFLLWTHQLPLGLYSAQASQSDNAGHTTRSAPHRFLIVPGSKVIGSTVTLTGSGTVSVPITCFAPPGATCAGDVLIVTKGKFQPTSGGPLGRLRLLFQFVQVPGGKTVAAQGQVSRSVARILRHAAPLKVEVTLALKLDGRVIARFTGGSFLRVR